MEFGEWCVFAALPIIVSPLGSEAVATLTVLINIELTFEILTFGLQESIQTFVGNALGSGSPKLAQTVALEIAALSLSIALSLILVFIYLGESILALFTSNETVLQSAVQCLPIFTVELILNQLQLSTGSVLHGLNRMQLPLIFRSISYYLVFIPALEIAQYYHCELWVVILQIAVISMVIVGVDALLIWRSDWHEISLEAIKETSEESFSVPILSEVEEDSDYF